MWHHGCRSAVQTRLDVGYSAYFHGHDGYHSHGPSHSCVHGLGREIGVGEHRGKPEVRMKSEMAEMARVSGDVDLFHRRTTGSVQNGDWARARAKVLYHRIKVGARVGGVCKLREGR